jgi:pyruvate/2-oxoglutarate dehydrogenase complex dihydrolipoamide dehydrogenase (E3) component
VALVEKNALGGTCLNFGCDPTKAALYQAKAYFLARRLIPDGDGLPDSLEIWRQIINDIHQMQERMRGGTRDEARQKMRERGINLFFGEATFVSPHEIQVDGEVLKAKQFLIATGAIPIIPDIPGLQAADFLTYQTVFDLEWPPEALTIVGAGPVGVEFAQFFTRIGTRVTLIEATSQILPQDDPELAAELEAILSDEGVDIKKLAEVTKITGSGSNLALELSYENGYQEKFKAERLMIATGRKPAIDMLGLDRIGLKTKDGFIETDDALQTNIAHIWAAGDVTSRYAFTHVATHHSAHVARNILKGRKKAFASRPIPWITYTDPELAHVGQSEAQLKEADISYRVITQSLENIARAVITGETHGMAKLFIDNDDLILGGQILAPNGGELINYLTLAMQLNLPATELANIIWPYPTMGSILGYLGRKSRRKTG